MTKTVASNYAAARANLDNVIALTGPADVDTALQVAQGFALLAIADSLKELNETARHIHDFMKEAMR